MDDERPITTTIRVTPAVWRALRLLAERRSVEHGGKPSVSRVVSEMALRQVAKEASRRADA